MKPETSSKDAAAKIYIGNIPPRCTERDIEDLCKPFGSLKRADIVKNFAFVIFDSKDSAQEAVSSLHDSTFQNARIQVEMARSKLHVDDKDDNQCYECGQKGHWARECPKRIARGGRRGPPPPRESSRREAPPPPRRRAPPPRDYYYDRAPARAPYDDYARGYDYDRAAPRGYDSYDRAPPPPRRAVEYPSTYRGRSRSPPPSRYPPSRGSDPYARDPYPRDSYYSSRDSYSSRSDGYSRDPYARSSDPYASYRQPQDNYASPYSTSQAKRYGDSSAPQRSAAGRY
eukprot:Seg1087.8 transcript_id=Seg1087.8/GoldUCD/mRNA.D3Y31 product="RNA-binding protein 4B" protein_id=Seg1087.8/GoldUCD/D3Y31